MNLWQRIKWAHTTSTRAAGTAGITPPARRPAYSSVSASDAVSLGTVYRAMQVMGTAAGQLSLTVHRGAGEVPADQIASVIKTPSVDMSRSDFIEQTVISLAATGNAFWMLHRAGAAGAVVDIEPLNPAHVGIEKNTNTGRLTYTYAGRRYSPDSIRHMYLLKLPGQLRGLGPIQAAQVEIRGALELRDYSSLWFSESNIPSGVLTSDQVLTAEDAAAYRATWNSAGTDSENPSGVRVLGKGTTYSPLMLKPADAQWLESKQFSTTEIARLFGMPASLLLAAVEGNAQTYSNVEQDWIAFTRFTLMQYLRKIEESLTALVPHGQSVRFNIEALLRSDTKTRYESHAMALGRWMTVEEIRAIEGLPPLSAAARADLDATEASAPAGQPRAALPAPHTTAAMEGTR